MQTANAALTQHTDELAPPHIWSSRKQLGSMAEFRESRTEMSNRILSYLNPSELVSL